MKIAVVTDSTAYLTKEELQPLQLILRRLFLDKRRIVKI